MKKHFLFSVWAIPFALIISILPNFLFLSPFQNQILFNSLIKFDFIGNIQCGGFHCEGFGDLIRIYTLPLSLLIILLVFFFILSVSINGLFANIKSRIKFILSLVILITIIVLNVTYTGYTSILECESSLYRDSCFTALHRCDAIIDYNEKQNCINNTPGYVSVNGSDPKEINLEFMKNSDYAHYTIKNFLNSGMDLGFSKGSPKNFKYSPKYNEWFQKDSIDSDHKQILSIPDYELKYYNDVINCYESFATSTETGQEMFAFGDLTKDGKIDGVTVIKSGCDKYDTIYTLSAKIYREFPFYEADLNLGSNPVTSIHIENNLIIEEFINSGQKKIRKFRFIPVENNSYIEELK